MSTYERVVQQVGICTPFVCTSQRCIDTARARQRHHSAARREIVTGRRLHTQRRPHPPTPTQKWECRATLRAYVVIHHTQHLRQTDRTNAGACVRASRALRTARSFVRSFLAVAVAVPAAESLPRLRGCAVRGALVAPRARARVCACACGWELGVCVVQHAPRLVHGSDDSLTPCHALRITQLYSTSRGALSRIDFHTAGKETTNENDE